MILMPFMLRRVKKDVQNELGDKVCARTRLYGHDLRWQIEKTVWCDLTPKQQRMYEGIKSKISLDDLVDESTAVNGDAANSALMNIVMQLRKVGTAHS